MRICNTSESKTKLRKDNFKELMNFNLDSEFAKAEKNLTKVNATQSFVNKALKKGGRRYSKNATPIA